MQLFAYHFGGNIDEVNQNVMVDTTSFDDFVSPAVVLAPRAQPNPPLDDSDNGVAGEERVVHEIGLEDILHLLVEDIPKCMGRWLLSNFVPENMCFQLENGLVVPVREEDVHYTLGLPRGGVITKRVVHLDRVVPCVVQSLHGWRSSHLKARQSVGVGSTGQEAGDTHHVRESVDGGTSVKTVDEEFVDKIGVLVAAVDDMLQLLECHPGQSSCSDTFRWVVSVARKILMLFDQSGHSMAEPHRNLGVGATQMDDDMWSNPENLRAIGVIERVTQQNNSAQQIHSFSFGLTQDQPTQGWREVEVVVRQYDNVTLNDPLWGSRLDTPDGVSMIVYKCKKFKRS
nr:uncharacterized protein LOC109178682 isoform X1 [Ipomoea batatas]